MGLLIILQPSPNQSLTSHHYRRIHTNRLDGIKKKKGSCAFETFWAALFNGSRCVWARRTWGRGCRGESWSLIETEVPSVQKKDSPNLHVSCQSWDKCKCKAPQSVFYRCSAVYGSWFPAVTDSTPSVRRSRQEQCVFSINRPYITQSLCCCSCRLLQTRNVLTITYCRKCVSYAAYAIEPHLLNVFLLCV